MSEMTTHTCLLLYTNPGGQVCGTNLIKDVGIYPKTSKYKCIILLVLSRNIGYSIVYTCCCRQFQLVAQFVTNM